MRHKIKIKPLDYRHPLKLKCLSRGSRCVGTILYPEGNQELTCVWGLAYASNEAEAVLVYQGLVLIKETEIKSTTVLGDSSSIVYHLQCKKLHRMSN